jgi:hypothetical protein
MSDLLQLLSISILLEPIISHHPRPLHTHWLSLLLKNATPLYYSTGIAPTINLLHLLDACHLLCKLLAERHPPLVVKKTAVGAKFRFLVEWDGIEAGGGDWED